MTIEESAKVLAVKYVLDYNTFRKSTKLYEDLQTICATYNVGNIDEDKTFGELFERYKKELEDNKHDVPRWATVIMAERYALNV